MKNCQLTIAGSLKDTDKMINYLRWVWSSAISVSIFSCMARLSASKSCLACLRAAASTWVRQTGFTSGIWLKCWQSQCVPWQPGCLALPLLRPDERCDSLFLWMIKVFNCLILLIKLNFYLLNNSSILLCSFSIFLTSFNREL